MDFEVSVANGGFILLFKIINKLSQRFLPCVFHPPVKSRSNKSRYVSDDVLSDAVLYAFSTDLG